MYGAVRPPDGGANDEDSNYEAGADYPAEDPPRGRRLAPNPSDDDQLSQRRYVGTVRTHRLGFEIAALNARGRFSVVVAKTAARTLDARGNPSQLAAVTLARRRPLQAFPCSAGIPRRVRNARASLSVQFVTNAIRP